MKKSLTSRLRHCCFFEFSPDLSDFDFRFSQLAPRFEFLFSGRSVPGFLFLAPSHAAARPKRLLILFRCRLFFPCSEIFPPVVDLVVAFSLKHAEGNSVSRSGLVSVLVAERGSQVSRFSLRVSVSSPSLGSGPSVIDLQLPPPSFLLQSARLTAPCRLGFLLRFSAAVAFTWIQSTSPFFCHRLFALVRPLVFLPVLQISLVFHFPLTQVFAA
jgi:hypothetical protein